MSKTLQEVNISQVRNEDESAGYVANILFTDGERATSIVFPHADDAAAWAQQAAEDAPSGSDGHESASVEQGTAVHVDAPVPGVEAD